MFFTRRPDRTAGPAAVNRTTGVAALPSPCSAGVESHLRRCRDLVEGTEPVLGSPLTGVGRVDGDDHSPALDAIWTRRSRNLAVGMPETILRKCLPRLPRDGRCPPRSRPISLASLQSRFPITIAWHLCSLASAMREEIAARRCPSRVVAGSPASSIGTATGGPTRFPEGSTTTAAR